VNLLGGRVALVTGAANGIGAAIAARFAAEGAKVAAVDREPVSGNVPRSRTWTYDLADVAGLPALVEEVERAVGPLDILVNCAAMTIERPALELTLDQWRTVVTVDLEAPVFLAIAAARSMAERGYGRIVNITSVHGAHGAEGCIAYDASKAALNNATRTLAVELAPRGVLVNALAPGFVHTRVADPDAEWFREVYVRQRKLPLGRQAQPNEIAAHVAWLASDQNTYMTGEVVTVDGGLTATF
jgi:NAD(P)-dependent dehydrogenase (short-subunit alcohol dehydrogenase family)